MLTNRERSAGQIVVRSELEQLRVPQPQQPTHAGKRNNREQQQAGSKIARSVVENSDREGTGQTAQV